ncbi:hypothetical protein Leryth_008684 [Lithospermum erythrorhizon]|nr:hypothetical protein Leryth_008684 [Lithospermum erythrorhizon]
MMSSSINLVMTVIGFSVSTMFIVFVCTRLICARIQLNTSRRSFSRANRSDLSTLERGLHGLEPYAVANFPLKKYNDANFFTAENTQCTVCLAEYKGEDILRILPSCGHSFHATCIDIWLQQHCTCPVCRISLRDHSEKKRFMQPMFSSAIRSHFSTESLDANPYQCVSVSRLPSRSLDNERMDPIQEEQCPLEGERREVGGSNSKFIGSSHTPKEVEEHTS